MSRRTCPPHASLGWRSTRLDGVRVGSRSSSGSASPQSSSTAGARIALCWNDWNPELGGRIRYYSSATQVSIVWRDVPSHANPLVRANMELVLAASGQIDLHFPTTMGQPTSTALTGLAAGQGTEVDLVDWSRLPIIDNASAHQTFQNNFDLIGKTLSLVPTTPFDYGCAQFPLSACQPTPPLQFASAFPYGKGCPPATAGAGSFYEQFASQSFDLSQASWRFVAQGSHNYQLVAGGSFDNSYGSNDQLTQGDDTLVRVSFAPMGGFPFLGQQHTHASASSDGYLWLAATGLSDNSPSVNEFTDAPPRIAPLWADWNFDEGGTGSGGKFYWSATPNYCLATWENVAAAGQPGSQNSFQAKLYPNGDIEFLYGTAINDSSTNGGLAIVGISAGDGSPDPGSVDFQNAAGQTVQLFATRPLEHSTPSAPRLGSTYNLHLQALHPLSPMTLFGLGVQQRTHDLLPLGLAGCTQHNSYDLIVLALPSLGHANYSLSVPFDQRLLGLRLYSQGAALPTSGPLTGMTMSNGLQGTIGW